MYAKNNPHLSILESMYELVKKHKNDQETEKLLADVLWALEFDLELDAYAYHHLAELSGGIGNDKAEGNDKYIESIEQKIQELKSK